MFDSCFWKRTASRQLAVLALLNVVSLCCLAARCLAEDRAAVAELSQPANLRFAKESEETPDFQRHVVPLLGRLGCNDRACHGSFQGESDFQLSLFGYDIEADHKAMFAGDEPRINLADAAESLILRKPTLAEDHDGGKRMEVGSWQYRVLRRWIEQGAKETSQDAATLVKLSVQPSEVIFTGDHEKTTLTIEAHWSDGTQEDVTPFCRFRSNDDSVAVVDASGKIESRGKGDTNIIVFYDRGIVPVQVISPVSERIGKHYPQVATPTKIDELVVAKLRKLGIVPTALADDATFLRRVSLDMTGTLPTPKEIDAFTADHSQDKRRKKIDELLQRPAYAAWWATKLCDQTGNAERLAGENQFRREQTQQWYEWIRQRVQKNSPYDELVAGIVLAVSREKDESFEEYCKNASAQVASEHLAEFGQRETMPHFWGRNRQAAKPKDHALRFSFAFMGVRLQCAECHKHPFDQWTQNDFQRFTAFFDSIEYGKSPENRRKYDAMTKALADGLKGGQAKKKIAEAIKQGKTAPWLELYIRRDRNGQPIAKGSERKKNTKSKQTSGRAITPKLLGGDQVVWKDGQDPRAPLMDWLREKDHPYFARAFVNRVWAAYFNVGIVQPPDDMNLANPASNEALLDYLARGFIEHRYDMKWVHRTIANSRTYQRGWEVNDTNRSDQRNFSHAVLRRLPAEVAYDAIVQSTSSDAKIAEIQQDHSVRMIGSQSANSRRRKSQFALTVFGIPARETNCDCERSNETSLLQTLFLRNDREVVALIDHRDGWIAQVASELGEPFRRGAAAGNPNPPQKKKNQTDANQNADVGELIRQAYLRTLSRSPTTEEDERIRKHLAASKSQVEGLRDLLWVLINSKEFIVNH